MASASEKSLTHSSRNHHTTHHPKHPMTTHFGVHKAEPANDQFVQFDPSDVANRLENLWALKAELFGVQSLPLPLYLDEIVSDRYCLINGMQVIRDELQIADEDASDQKACAVNYSLPTTLITLAYTNCGDRVSSENTPYYVQVVGSRFSCLKEDGAPKVEIFTPAGGGTDDGNVLFSVTYHHSIDQKIKKKLYNGNPRSFVSCNFDLMTHVGRYDSKEGVKFGKVKESPWRDERDACGAVIGCLSGYNENNVVHKRIRSNIGEENFKLLSTTGVKLADGTNITNVVAAGIVAIQGMLNTAQAAAHDNDDRVVSHLTATITLNTTSTQDSFIYVGRATVFRKEIKVQGFGTDASKWSGYLKDGNGILILTYDGKESSDLPVNTVPAH